MCMCVCVFVWYVCACVCVRVCVSVWWGTREERMQRRKKAKVKEEP